MPDLGPFAPDDEDDSEIFTWTLLEDGREVARMPMLIDPLVGDVLEIVVDGRTRQFMVLTRRLRAVLHEQTMDTSQALDVRRVTRC